MLYASAYLIKSVYGKDALTRLDEDEDDLEEEEEEGSATCIAEIKYVQLIELDELIVGALNKHSYQFAQNSKYDRRVYM